MQDTRTISERLRRGKLAYTAAASTVYEGPTLQDTEAADTIDALVFPNPLRRVYFYLLR